MCIRDRFKIYCADFDITQNSRVTLNNANLGVGNRGIITLQNDAIETTMPKLSLVMNASLNYTIGARLTQETTLAQATIINTTAGGSGTILEVNDITGNWSAGSNTGGVIQNRVISSKTEATVVVSNPTGDYTVGETVTGGTSNATGEVVTWTSGCLLYTSPSPRDS